MAGSPWWKMGWRNLGRNWRRTLLSALGLAIGYFSVVLFAGLIAGVVADLVRNGTGLMTGQIQLHHGDYLPDRNPYDVIGRDDPALVAELLAALEADPGIVAAAPRVYGGGLVSAGSSTVGAILMGVDPDRDVRATRLLSALTKGRLPRAGEREVLVGAEMARRLAVEPGDEIVVVAPASDGSMGNDLFQVVGVSETGVAALDAAQAVLPIGTLRELLALRPGEVHEIVAAVSDPWEAPDIRARLEVTTVRDGLALRDWTAFRPELVEYARLVGAANWIMLVVVFGMAIFGVANTMVMATYERRREFAVLIALGAGPGKVVRTVLYEALAMGTLSLVAGLAITLPVLYWLHHHPFELPGFTGGFSLAGAFYEPVWRVEYTPGMAVWTAFALLLTATLAALYPAYRASRVLPADALSD